ncbi:MAG: hypothetical protein P4L75_01755 [Clostridia bacterium]|nr:hypothetical protein [Clostridia bacterium]
MKFVAVCVAAVIGYILVGGIGAIVGAVLVAVMLYGKKYDG